jgi:hypothetical protein
LSDPRISRPRCFEVPYDSILWPLFVSGCEGVGLSGQNYAELLVIVIAYGVLVCFQGNVALEFGVFKFPESF